MTITAEIPKVGFRRSEAVLDRDMGRKKENPVIGSVREGFLRKHFNLQNKMKKSRFILY
jgi:hypothetical protein